MVEFKAVRKSIEDDIRYIEKVIEKSKIELKKCNTTALARWYLSNIKADTAILKTLKEELDLAIKVW